MQEIQEFQFLHQPDGDVYEKCHLLVLLIFHGNQVREFS